MTATSNPIEMLLQFAQMQGISAQDLYDHMAAAARVGPMPTVREFLPVVEAATSTKSTATYRTYWNKLVDALGDRRLDEVRTSDIARFAKNCKETAIQRSTSIGGTGAQTNAVTTARAFFKLAVDDRLISVNPALAVPKPKKNSKVRWALDVTQLHELDNIACTTGTDPELDSLLMRFHLETAARRGGAVKLTIGALNLHRQTATLHEKGDKQNEVPLTQELIEAMIAHCERRAVGPVRANTPVFHYRNGMPLTRRHYNNLAERWHKHLPWAAQAGVSVHWLRHTVLTDVERLCGEAVAAKLAGHEPSSVARNYTKATIEDVARALTLRCGETHPLAEAH